MSRYLAAWFAQADGGAGQVRLRPKTRFEGDCGGLWIDEQPLPPAVAASHDGDTPRLPPIEPVAKARPAVETAKPSPDFHEPAGPAPPSPGRGVHRDIIRERIETNHYGERLIERHDRVVEHRERLERIERIETRVDNVSPAMPSVTPPKEPSPGSPANVAVTAAAPAAPQPVASEARRMPLFAAAPQSPAAMKSEPAPKIEPEITVSIGRLDIRLVTANEIADRAPKHGSPRSAAESMMPLTEYLLRRERSTS